MKMLCKNMLASGLVLLAVLVMPQWVDAAAAKGGQGTFSKAELKRMSIFLSNFTELSMMNFTAEEVLDPKNPDEAISFGIWHNFRNNYRSRIVQADREKYDMGDMAIEAKYVLESIEKYFGKNPQFVRGLQANQPKKFDGKFYYFMGADGGNNYHANVQSAQTNADGTITMRGQLYNANGDHDSYGVVFGPLEAVGRPHTFKGKATWAIIRLSVPDWKY